MWIFFLALLPALSVSGETVVACATACPPGSNDCTNCCIAQFTAKLHACQDDCVTSQQSCWAAAHESCKNTSDPDCFRLKAFPCSQAIAACRRDTCNGATMQIQGGCPGEAAPRAAKKSAKKKKT